MKPTGLHWDRMAAFVAVAQSGSFTAAAERLEVTKSALSRAVSLLERELGVQLLRRSTRRLAITEAGRTFLDRCEVLQAQATQLMEETRSARSQPSGTLKLTSPPDIASLVAHWIAEYRRRYPGISIEFHPTEQRVNLIEGGFDLGLRIGIMRDSQLRAVKLMELDLVLVASAEYLRVQGVPKGMADLSKHEWIAHNILPAPWTLSLTSKSGATHKVRMRGSVSVSTSVALRALALEHQGIVALPRWNVQADLASGLLRPLLPSYRLPTLSFFAVYAGSGPPPAKTRAFIDLIKADRLDSRLTSTSR